MIRWFKLAYNANSRCPSKMLFSALILACFSNANANSHKMDSSTKNGELLLVRGKNLTVTLDEYDDGISMNLEISAFGQKFNLKLESEDVNNVGRFQDLVILSGTVSSRNGGAGGRAFMTYDKETRAISGRFNLGHIHYSLEEGSNPNQTWISKSNAKNPKIRPKRDLKHDSALNVTILSNSTSTQKLKRSERGNVCEMLVMVDHSLYESLGGNEKRAAKLAMRLVAAASKVYEEQVFVAVGREVEGVRLRLKEILVATDEICQDDKYENSYLCKPSAFARNSDRLLRMHSRTDFSSYCLSYLFTSLDFDSTLGVAYVGGVCADRGLIRDEKTGAVERRSINAGFITVEDVYTAAGEEVAAHTMAHEVGHNFGASHDDPAARGDCSGFLMEPVAPSRITEKRLTFSPCSMDAIRDVISQMRRGGKDWCFVKEEKVVKTTTTKRPVIVREGGGRGTFGGKDGTFGGGKDNTFGGGGNTFGGGKDKTFGGKDKPSGGGGSTFWGGRDRPFWAKDDPFWGKDGTFWGGPRKTPRPRFGGDVEIDVVEDKDHLGLIVGLSSSLLVVILLAGMLVAYAFVEQRFCFGTRNLTGDPDWLRKDVADVVETERRRISRVAHSIRSGHYSHAPVVKEETSRSSHKQVVTVDTPRREKPAMPMPKKSKVGPSHAPVVKVDTSQGVFDKPALPIPPKPIMKSKASPLPPPKMKPVMPQEVKASPSPKMKPLKRDPVNSQDDEKSTVDVQRTKPFLPPPKIKPIMPNPVQNVKPTPKTPKVSHSSTNSPKYLQPPQLAPVPKSSNIRPQLLAPLSKPQFAPQTTSRPILRPPNSATVPTLSKPSGLRPTLPSRAKPSASSTVSPTSTVSSATVSSTSVPSKPLPPPPAEFRKPLTNAEVNRKPSMDGEQVANELAEIMRRRAQKFQ